MKSLFVSVETGRDATVRLGTPVLSSSQAPWQDVYFEQLGAGPIEAVNVAPRDHIIVVQLDRPAQYEWQSGGYSEVVNLPPGHISLFPAARPYSARSKDTREFLAIALGPKALLRAAHEVVRADVLELAPRHAVNDPLLRGVALSLKAEVEAGYPGGRWYGESLANTLGVHLACRYLADRLPSRSQKPGLSRAQLARAIDFIHDNLGREVPLETLAATVGLSPFHFARLFKQSTGMAPHQYLIRRRVERAKELLLSTDVSVVQIALQVGFCDQSHFAAHFKRIYGVAPKAFVHQAAPRSKTC